MQQLLKDLFPIFFPKSFKRSLPNFGNWKQCKHASGSRNVSHGPVILDGNDKSQLDSPPFLRTSYGLDLTLGVQDLIPGHLKIGKNIIRKWWRVHADPIYREISIPIEAPKSQISLEPAIFAPRSLAFLFMKSSVCAQSFAGTGWQTELVGFWLKVVDAMHSESVFFSQESLSSTTYPEEKVCVMRFKISPETCESHASHGIQNIDLHQTSKVEGFFRSTVESQPPK